MKQKTLKASLRSYLFNFTALLVLFAVLCFLVNRELLSRYYQGIIVLSCVNIILAVSLNITTGFLGQITLGHAGFMSIGAYTGALVAKAMTGVPDAARFFLSLLTGGLLAALFGVLMGVPALRLKGDYLAIITLGMGEIVRVIIENMKITGGAQGLRAIPRIADIQLVFVVTVLSVAIIFAFIRSRHGRAIQAICEDDIASEASGIPNTYYKVLAFVVAAFFAGVAGAIYAEHYTVLGAKSFGFLHSIELLVIVVLGGMGSLTGSVIAAIVLTILPEALRGFEQYRMLVYSIALIAIMIFKPTGLFGTYEFSLTRLIDRLLGRDKKEKLRKAVQTSGKGGAKG